MEAASGRRPFILSKGTPTAGGGAGEWSTEPATVIFIADFAAAPPPHQSCIVVSAGPCGRGEASPVVLARRALLGCLSQSLRPLKYPLLTAMASTLGVDF